jgi:hypothetical protein
MRKENGNRAVKFEALENRELMAVDVSFNSGTGALNIQGTAGDESIALVSNGYNQTEIFVNWNRVSTRVNGALQGSLPTNGIRSITANLGGGRDEFSSWGYDANALNPNSVDIVLGRGVNQRVNVDMGEVRNIRVDARGAVATTVTLSNTSVTDRIFVNMGGDGSVSNDWLILNGNDIKTLEASMGGGNDTIRLENTIIRNVDVVMGAGNDSVQDWGNNSIRAGVIDGGSGADDYMPDSLRRRVRAVGFERK